MRSLLHVRGRGRARISVIALVGALLVPIAPASVAATGGLFLPYQAIVVPSEPDAVAIGDVTGDGRADVVATTGYDFDAANDFHLLVLAQGQTGSLLAPVSYATAGSYTARPGSVAIGDITGDGRADVVVGLDRYGIQVFPQVPDGTLGAPTFTPTGDSTRVQVGRLDGDDTLDVAGIGWGSNTVSVFANIGNGGLGGATVYPALHAGWDDLEIADVSGDGRDDLVVMSGQLYSTPNLSVLAQLPSGGFAPAAEYRVGTNVNTNGIGVGDVNGDGRNDVVASYGGNRPSSFIAAFTQLANGTLAAPVSYPSYDIPEPVEVADLDLDGRADVVTLHGGWNKAGVYLGQPNASLGTETLYDIPYASHYSVHGLAVGDVTGDGWPDVVEADYNNGVIVLRNRGIVQPTVPDAPILTSATPGDGRVALAWTPPISDGGAPVSGYTATASPGGASCSISGLGCSITGLTNNTTYTFSVRASNSAGMSAPSNALAATPGVAPSAPRSLTTSPNLAAGVGLSWQPPSSSGSLPLSGYRIYRGGIGAPKTLLAIVGNVLAFTDTAVVNGGQYVYQVSAVNGFGEGARSTDATAQRGTAPSIPRNPSASTGGPGITIAWASPATTGGSPITGYRVYRATVSGAEAALATVAPGTTSYLDKTVAKKTRYYYWVTAINVLGESAPSSEVNATSR